jgi:HAD superfamily hydrolase (TIGR01509 family)
MNTEHTSSQKDWHNGIRSVLCDVGGVLIHKRRTPQLQQWERALRCDLPLAVWLCSAGLRATLGQASVEDVWYEIQQTYGLTKTELQAFRQDFEASDQIDTAFVHFLHGVRNVCKIALLSNAWPGARSIFGNDFGLATLTDIMILSYEEGLAKPDQRIYNLAAKRLGLPPSSIVFLDDYAPNVAAAQACGMHGVLFETREQTITELQALLSGG